MRPWLPVVSCLLLSLFVSHLRLDGGCTAEEGRSSSSLARLLLLLAGPGPRFADDMLERSGGGGELGCRLVL
jgi:hypothetical protein